MRAFFSEFISERRSYFKPLRNLFVCQSIYLYDMYRSYFFLCFLPGRYIKLYSFRQNASTSQKSIRLFVAPYYSSSLCTPRINISFLHPPNPSSYSIILLIQIILTQTVIYFVGISFRTDNMSKYKLTMNCFQF